MGEEEFIEEKIVAVQNTSTQRNGVLKVLTKEDRKYYEVEDVMLLLGIKRSKAYKIMRSLRQELIASGRLIDEYPAGRVPKRYFNARCGID